MVDGFAWWCSNALVHANFGSRHVELGEVFSDWHFTVVPVRGISLYEIMNYNKVNYENFLPWKMPICAMVVGSP